MEKTGMSNFLYELEFEGFGDATEITHWWNACK